MLRVLVVTLVSASAALAQSPVSPPRLLWARTAAGSGFDAVTSVAVDPLGNCYTAGWFYSNPVDFGTTTLTNRGSGDGFLNKYDFAGVLLWSRQYGDTGEDNIRQVTLDGSASAIIAGRFAGTLNFGHTNLTADGNDIFVAKISTDGDCIWAVKAGGEGYDYPESISIDGEGNCYVGGFINSTNAQFGQFTVSKRSTTYEDPFIAKYNASGQIQWVQQISSPGYGYGIRVAANPGSGVYVTGSFEGPGTFGPTNLVSNVTRRLFLASFGPDGALRWVNQAGEDTPDDGSYGTDVVADRKGNVYLTGFFSGPVAHFGSLSVTNTSADGGWNPDIFLARYDEQGAVHWVISAGGAHREHVSSVALDGAGDLYLAGSFTSSNANFGGIVITNNFTPPVVADGFLAKYTANGDVIWVKQVGGSRDDVLWNTAVDVAGNVFIAGMYQSSDMGLGLPPSVGSYDSFVAKFETAIPPLLKIRSTGFSTGELRWSALAEGFYLEFSSTFQSESDWHSNTVPVERFGSTNRVIIDTSSAATFYRLKRAAF